MAFYCCLNLHPSDYSWGWVSIIALTETMLCSTTQVPFSRLMGRLHFTASITFRLCSYEWVLANSRNVGGTMINISIYYFLEDSQGGYCGYPHFALSSFLLHNLKGCVWDSRHPFSFLTWGVYYEQTSPLSWLRGWGTWRCNNVVLLP